MAVPDIVVSQRELFFPTATADPSARIENVIFITNKSAEPFIWKMRRSPRSPFLVHPTTGILHPREERRVTISCTAEDLTPDITSSKTERLQVIARFFHATDNRASVAECFNNKEAEDMKKLKLDLPVVFANEAPKQMVRHQRSVSRELGHSGSGIQGGGDGGAVSASTPQRQPLQDSGNTPGNASTAAVSQSPARNDPAAASPSPAPRSSTMAGSGQSSGSGLRKQDSAGGMVTPASSGVYQQQQQAKGPGAAAVAGALSSPTAPAAKKQGVLTRAVLCTLPIYIFFPLIVMAFLIGIKVGGTMEMKAAGGSGGGDL